MSIQLNIFSLSLQIRDGSKLNQEDWPTAKKEKEQLRGNENFQGDCRSARNRWRSELGTGRARALRPRSRTARHELRADLADTRIKLGLPRRTKRPE